MLSRDVRARVRRETAALYSFGDPSSTPKNSSMRSRGQKRGVKQRKAKKKKKKKQYDDGMPRPVQRPGCLRLPVIPIHRILLPLQYTIVLEIMAVLSPNPSSQGHRVSSYMERNK